MTPATLALENGTILTGKSFGAAAESVFELVFNTSMTGYQEILTDPSYKGQAVVFTAPHIGNVGINLEDYESTTPHIAGVVVRSLSRAYSNWRAVRSLDDWLREHAVPGITGVDTRFLTRLLRDGGTMKAALSTSGTAAEALVETAREWPGLDGRDMVREVTCPEPYVWTGDRGDAWVSSAVHAQEKACRVALYDFGAKRNILRHLAAWGAEIMVFPADTPAGEILAARPDGIVLSNGPGDPAGLPYAVENVRRIIDSGAPTFGICLGHQLIGMALGGKTARLKFGHHGGNHPVQDLRTGEVLITSQNHNFMVLAETLDKAAVEITHLSLNDGSVEGLRLHDRPAFSVQFHPEASPGPHDSRGLFGRFMTAVAHHQKEGSYLD